ncbi:gamma-glutamyl-gamma-aminobutyrate hydrolase family protein [Fluoribacter dumoffii]|uniref:Carbamoyl phosphate synthase small subunit n=1 Tax=Fluoribacter dumoffii TaxID=463 RepID=A0A377GDX7_9GAMM|nr:gamma-glutamyl-gamma-aminobutyrate hydrolase family protein [Fluoribacter dumoffii]KTC91073.1 carbamoyl phosphate synthase small subunit [Fluoribacter dumoffii NY 23]MCW8387758.1 gamma-glutamyl-gamma-aminobutyrate hydrolase family protein [Fluoribacter dumoffii]MCW8416684.1 gamma-glutamyl-gamma-aminobutyrate hydrolase family protein [Fluoribacter dumoffii]MCW8455476.1 gamma-glutamyl-gamma-aminobutyrate hydrolase family protein [Fluoribacter dumoffii]MCW8460445.1 gamma-glutamyl-gamma-aminobu
MFSKFISSGWPSFSTLFSERSETKEEKANYQYELNAAEEKQLRHAGSKPKVVALYDEQDGSRNAELAIQHFENDGLDVIRVSSDEGIDHPAFKNDSIDGIYLPGGSDIPVENESDPRKKFEGQLTQLARTRDIPLIGVCRGEQALGHHNRLEVKDLPDYEKHYAGANNGNNPDVNNTVVVEKGSQLFAALQNEFKEDNNEGPIEYSVTCLHHQHIEEPSADSELKVTGRNKFDNSVESVELKTGNYYSFGVQHHPEVLISSCEITRKEKIIEAQKEAEEARFTSNFFDPDPAIYSEIKYAQKIGEAYAKSREERAARAEMGFFTKQAKKHFLEHEAKQKAKQTSDVDTRKDETLYALWS